MRTTLVRIGRRTATAILALGLASSAGPRPWYEPKNLEEQTKIARARAGCAYVRANAAWTKPPATASHGPRGDAVLEEFKPLYCPPPRFMVEQVRENRGEVSSRIIPAATTNPSRASRPMPCAANTPAGNNRVRRQLRKWRNQTRVRRLRACPLAILRRPAHILEQIKNMPGSQRVHHARATRRPLAARK